MISAATVERSQAHIGVNNKKGVKHRKARADGGCLDCGLTGQPMKSGTCCKKCVTYKRNTATREIIGVLVQKARNRHMKKNNGKIDGFDVSIDNVLQKIMDLDGYCGISRVVPLSFDKQSPFIVSIEDLPGTPAGYHKDGWTVSTNLFNLGSQPITADFKMLGQGKVEYLVTDVHQPGKIDDITVIPVKPDDGREWVICCICWVLGDKESMSWTYCQDCKSWYNHKMDQKLSMMAAHGKEADETSKRPAPVDLSTETLKALLEVQGNRCAVSGLPFAHGVKQGERYAPFAISCDRMDNDRSHDLDNVRLVCSLFNPSDGNRQKEMQGVNCAPEGHVAPFSYGWTKEDCEILKNLCTARW